MKFLDSDAEAIISIVSVTENETEAKNIVEIFLKGSEPGYREEFLTELEKRDSRFLGWDSKYVFEYERKNVSGDALYLTRPVAEIIKSGNYRIKLTLEEVL